MSANRLFIVTNNENLELFFDYGLIFDRQGFSEGTYFEDAMKNRPYGYIPCFPQRNLWDALKAAKTDDDNLTECLLEIDIKQINFASSFWRSNDLEKEKYCPVEIKKHLEIDSNILSEVLLPAPLPLSCVKKIILKDSKRQKSIISKYESNFGSGGGKPVTIEAKLFKEPKTKESTLPLKPPNDFTDPTYISGEVPPRHLNYSTAFSYGGALSLLYYQTKNGRESTRIFEFFSGISLDHGRFQHFLHLSALFSEKSDEDNESIQLYRKIINCIYDQGSIDETRFKVLQLLKSKNDLPPSYADDCGGLATSLTQLVERTNTDTYDAIFSKLIKYYETRESGRSKIFLLLTMFFVRDHSETMLKYYHSEFTEEDYALLAIFFGAINGFVNTPSIIRGSHDLATWASFKMAEYMHKQSQNNPAYFLEPSKPFMIYNKCFKSISTNNKLHDFYEWFSSEIINVPDSEFISWKQNEEYEQKKEGQFFKTRPKTKAEVNYQHLENLIAKKTISDSNDLFSFNSIIDSYKKMLR